jgi:hypothetical protein
VQTDAEQKGLFQRIPVRVWGLVLAGVLTVGAGALLLRAALDRPALESSCTALARARIATVLAMDGASLHCSGVHAKSVDSQSDSGHPLNGSDADALVKLLKGQKATAIAVVPSQQSNGISLRARLARLEHVEGLRALLLTPAIAVYAAERTVELSEKERTALVYVARALLRGAREPSLSSFPPSLRRVESVEVMVSLAPPGGSRLLWRSTRGTSIPRALLSATRVARDRWHEREATMGGPLRERLPSLEVEVSLLVDDGTIASAEAGFVDRAVTKEHGLGFDFRSDWHYLMPLDVQKRGQGSPYRALTALGADYGVGVASLSREETRIYRFLMRQVGVSPPTANTASINLRKSAPETQR